MKILVILVVACSTLFYSFSGNQSKQKWQKKENGTIGDIKYSILEPEQFELVNGKGWVLLDGKPLDTNSDLYTLLQSAGLGNLVPNGKLPNGDGVFIRGVDTNEEDSYGDSQKNRAVGSFQEDMTGPHKHPQIVRRAVGDPGSNNVGFSGAHNDPHNASDSTGVNTGYETRPINISFYTYIKINNNTNE